MFIRHSRAILLTIGCVVALVANVSPSSAEDPKPVVSLVLTRASAERSAPDTLFRCEVSLDNATADDLTVNSNFTSAFDSLELVVTTVEGKVLAQQSHAYHQSPFAQARSFSLKKGVSTATLRFPIREVPGDAKVVRVRLVGTLPESGYDRILSTETLEVRIK